MALKVQHFCGHWHLEVDAMIPRSFCTRRPSPVRLAAGLLLTLILIPALASAQPSRSWAVRHNEGGVEEAGCARCGDNFQYSVLVVKNL